MRSGLVIHSGLALAILMIPMTAAGQTSYAAEAAKYPDAASKPTPKMADGHPDLNGVWHHYFGIGTVQKVGDSFVVGLGRPAATKSAGPPPPRPQPDAKPEYKTDYVAKAKSLNENQVKEDPTLHCRPPGVPRLGPPQQIVHMPKQAVFLYADLTGNQWRVIPLDGRPHGTDPEQAETYNGDSVGRWEGDTLVVDVTRLTDDTWLEDNGMFHSNKLHVTEKLRRVGDTIQYQMTAEDPEVLQKPWTISRTLTLQRDALDEAAPCVDSDAGHYVNGEHHDNGR
ncbi:MAG TPA: hypothetical protein VN841_29835 [Bryobacteraceae bacterium]|nr:hypothetical protein [Bryobacteraceae bacterium]